MSGKLANKRTRESQTDFRVGTTLINHADGTVDITILFGHLEGRSFVDTDSQQITLRLSDIPALGNVEAGVDAALISLGILDATAN
jgi:hypothetical protein